MKKKRVQKIIAWIVTFAFTFQAIPLMAIAAPIPGIQSSEADLAADVEKDVFMQEIIEDESLSDDKEQEEINDPLLSIPSDKTSEDDKASENDETFVLSDVMPGIESDTDRNIDGELEDLREPSVKYF